MKFQILLLFALFDIIFLQTITSISPLFYRIPDKDENMTIKLNFNQNVIEQRNKTYLTLSSSYCGSFNITIIQNTRENNPNSIEYIYPINNIKCFGIYNITFMNNTNKVETPFKIYIYASELALIKPKQRYFFVSDSTNKVSASYEFEKSQAREAINKIICYNKSNPNNNNYIINLYSQDFNISDKRLEVFMSPKKDVVDYYCDIYPTYSPSTTLSNSQRFEISFHEYLLETEAIYLDKDTNNEHMMFKLRFVSEYDNSNENRLIIQEDSTEINYNYTKKENYLYEFYISPGTYNYPGKYKLFYKKTQERELFFVLYTKNYAVRCYNKTTPQLISIFFYWTLDMNYNHPIYFNDTNFKQIHYYIADDQYYITANYSITSDTMGIGVYSLKSSIPALNYTDYNPVDPDKLIISITDNINVNPEQNIILFKNNRSDQIFNITLRDRDTVSALDNLTFYNKENKANSFKLSKTDGECKGSDSNPNSSSNYFYCNLTDYINDTPLNNIVGNYSVSYSDMCLNLANITGLKIEIRQTYNLESLEPKWINQTKVNGTNLTLIFDDNIENHIQSIIINNKTGGNIVYNFSSKDDRIKIDKNIITIKFNDTLAKGVYRVNLSSDIDIDYNGNEYFKVSNENISFDFSHHYFALKSGGANYLRINVSGNKSDFNCKLLSSNGINITNISEACDIFNFTFDQTGRISFSYFDKDNFLIPINDNITIVEVYTNLFNFINWQNCYYYKFDLSVQAINTFQNINLVIFLKNTTNNNNYNLIKKDNKFENNMNNSESGEVILYVSEATLDDEVFLFKSTIYVTQITVPTYIMKPNLNVAFKNVICDLSKNKFEMFKYPTNSVSKRLDRCRYNNNQQTLTCEISGNFYTNNLFGYYSYKISDKNILLNNTNQSQITFASNRLNDSDFSIRHEKNQLKYSIYIDLKNNDFYFPLISKLTNYKLINQNYQAINLFRNNTNEILINDTSNSIRFNISLEIKGVYIVGNLTRKKEEGENDDESLYHNFYYTINNTIFSISPTIFAYNKIKPDQKFEILIAYNDYNEMGLFTQTTNLTNCQDESSFLYRRCELNINDNTFIKDQPQNFTISIGNNNNKTIENIKFIYYKLSDNSKKCQTKSNNTNIEIDVYFPDVSIAQKLELETKLNKNKNTINNTYSQYILYGDQDDMLNGNLEFYINNDNFYHSFSLKDIELNVLPHYNLSIITKESKLYLFPINDQVVMVTIDAGEFIIVNLSHIVGFQIKNKKDQNSKYNLDFDKIDDSTRLNIKFDLESAVEGNYDLYYRDSCNYDIKSNIEVIIKRYEFPRQYFVLNNKHNYDGQKMTVNINHDVDMNVSIYLDNVKKGNMYHVSGTKEYSYNLGSDSEGVYSFEANYKEQNILLKQKVYVKKELSDLLKITQEPTSCIYNNDILKEIVYKITPSENGIVSDISIFNSYLNGNSSYPILFDFTVNGNEKTFTSTLQNNINRYTTYFIFLTENADKQQPIFVFTFSYTKISLLSNYSQYIYTDTSYIQFSMSCKLAGDLTFHLKKRDSDTDLKIICDGSLSIYNSNLKAYKCQFYLNSSELNNLLGNNIEVGYYNLIYQSDIIQENIFVSYEIKKINIAINHQDPVFPNKNLTIQLIVNGSNFYMPNIDSVSYYEGTNIYERKYAKVNRDSLIIDINYFECTIYITKKIKHIIYEVCRKKCINCINPIVDCTQLVEKKEIISNLPEVYFDFDRHYINLASSYQNIVNIKVREDADEIENIYYNYYNYTSNGNYTGGRVYKLTTYDYFLMGLTPGKYTFMYKAFAYNQNISIQNDMVFVTNNLEELLYFHNDSNNCLFYKKTGQKGIFAYLTVNTNFPFNKDVPISDFDLYIDEIRFPYAKNLGYQIVEEYENNFQYNSDDPRDIYIVEKNVNPRTYRFGKIEKIRVTSFDIDFPVKYNYSYFYKDNIVFMNMYCNLENIYIQIKSNQFEDYSHLICDYDAENKKSYCDAKSCSFKYGVYSGDFEFFIGYNFIKENFTYDIEQSALIYNSINTSEISAYYIYPNLTIYSNNFSMVQTSYIIIDDNNLSFTNFTDIDTKYIIISNKENLSAFNYLYQITRQEHEKDRNITCPPRTKYLNITINTCPQYQKFDSGKCRTCNEIALMSGTNNRWYQAGECVEKCEPPYYIFNSKDLYCEKCDIITCMGGQCVCGCLEGTVFLDEDNICYLPESPEIQKASLNKPNLVCYRGDGKTHNYCRNDTTKNCNVTSISGHDFPICECMEGFGGKYCEHNNSEPVNLETSNLDEIIEKRIDNQIDENNTQIISKIRGMIFYFESDVNYEYVKEINPHKIDTYIDSTVELVKNSINRESVGFQIYDIIELGVYFLNYTIKNRTDNESYKNKLAEILNNAHYLNFISNRDNSNFNINNDGLNLISFVNYRNDAIDLSFKKYIRKEYEKSNTIGFIDLFNNLEFNQHLVLTIINRNLFQDSTPVRNLEENGENINNNDNSEGIVIIFSTPEDTTDLTNLKNFKVYLYSPISKVNYDLANYYQQYDIGIYNIYDDCFIEPCYYNKKMEYDLTQKYRKKYLFQKLLLKSNNCRYNSFDLETNTIEFLCSKFDDFYRYTYDNGFDYSTLNITIKKHRLENENKEYKLLPFKCTNKIDDLKGNIALRLFFVVFAIEIIYILAINILTIGGLRAHSIIKGLNNDKMIKNTYDDFIIPTDEKIFTKAGPEIYNWSLLRCFYENIKELHPLFSLTRVSVIQPLILQSWLVVFNALCYFGFNALLYWEGLIEERIYKPYRDNFAYPMRKEFGKIILTILCQIVLCVLIKLLIMVKYDSVIEMKSRIDKVINKKSEDFAFEDKCSSIYNILIERANLFEKDHKIRRLIGGFLMLFIIVFFFYYSVVFCGIYIKTQWCWLYSSLWTLIWNYLILSPIYIGIISVIEHNKMEDKQKKKDNKYYKDNEDNEANEVNKNNNNSHFDKTLFLMKRLFIF